MGVTAETIAKAKLLEGLPDGKPALKAYRDIAGVWTNGYGNTHDVNAQTPDITAEQAETDLIGHLVDADQVISRYVTVPLTANQRGALQLFILNVGEGVPRGDPKRKPSGFAGSTLLTVINERRYADAPAQFMRWTKYFNPKTGQHENSQGLINRRSEEVALWTKPSSVSAVERSVFTKTPVEELPPVDIVKPVEPPQPTTALGTSTGKASATALGTGVLGALSSAEPVANAIKSFAGVNGQNLLSFLSVAFVLGCIGTIAWLLWDRQRKVREEGR